MSQFYVTPPGGAPATPTSFQTQNGTATPSASVLIVNGFDSTENNDNGIITKGGVLGTGTANEVDVVLTNRIQISGNISSGPTFSLVTFPLGATRASYRFNFDIIVRVTASSGAASVGDTMGYTLFSTFKTDGATATRTGTPFIDTDEDTNVQTALIDMVASVNNAILQFTPAANTDVTYNVVGYYTKI